MLEDQLETSPNFKDVESRVFTEHGGNIYIGTEKITPELRDVLREQARYLKTSQLFEILGATIINESSKLALIQSQNYEQVLSAKMLYHWKHVIDNMVYCLTKE